MVGHARRPAWLVWGSTLLWLNTLGMPAQVVWLFGHNPLEWHAIWHKLTDLNRLVVALSPIAALGLGRASRWGWLATMGFLTVAVVNNLILLRFTPPMPLPWVLAATALLVACGAWMVRPSVLSLCANPRSHWWKTPRRYPVSVPVSVAGHDRGPWNTTTVNVSRSGAFVLAAGGELRPGQQVGLVLHFRNRLVNCGAKVVRSADGRSGHPAGYGLDFGRLSLSNRAWLRARLPRMGP